MTREDLNSLALQSLCNECTILELSTGVGKTKIAINMVNELKVNSILIVVAKIVHKENWHKEIIKWGGINASITIECYESLHKYKNANFDVIILDEVQHLSIARREILKTINVKHVIGLSATIKKEMKDWFRHNYVTNIIQYTLQDAIDSSVLPEPTIYLFPLHLNNYITPRTSCTIVMHKNKGPVIKCSFNDRWKYINRPFEIHVECSQIQYLNDLNSQIEWWKTKYMRSKNEVFKIKWLKLCNDRLKWLSECKNDFIITLLDKFRYERTLTFCSSIPQVEVLGENCIHSKNNKATKVLEDFNNNVINHITSCQILNEGINLSNCRIGIFANINSSEIITRQRNGRILRHEKPIIIIPYYVGTREEEIVNKHLLEYDPKLIRRIGNINEIEL